MSIKFIIAIIIALLNIFLGLIILRKNYKNPSNIYYAGLCMSGGLWALFQSLLFIVNSQLFLDFVYKCIYIFAIFPPFFYLMFTYHHPYKLWVYPQWLIKLIYFLPLAYFCLILFGFMDFNVVRFINGTATQNIIFNNFLFFTIYFFFYIVWGILILFKKFKNTERVHRIHIKYIIMATVITFIITGIVNVIMPLLDNFTYDWLGGFFILINFICIGYLIFIKPKVLR